MTGTAQQTAMNQTAMNPTVTNPKDIDRRSLLGGLIPAAAAILWCWHKSHGALKLPPYPQRPDAPAIKPHIAPMTLLSKQLKDDPGYALSWHANLACAAMDHGCDSVQADKIAASFMKRAFDIDTSHDVIVAYTSPENNLGLFVLA